jgi:hypothetical protein
MELLERQKLAADAILLERAMRVMERRFPELTGLPRKAAQEHPAVAWTRNSARILRREAERG